MEKSSIRLSFILAYMFLAAIFCFLTGCQLPHPTPKPSVKWQRLGPGAGGALFAPVYHPLNPRHIIMRTDMGGNYLTKDGGKSWDMIDFPVAGTCFTFDPIDTNTLYIGGKTLQRTRDGGKTWQQCYPGPGVLTGSKHAGDQGEFGYTYAKDFPYGEADVTIIKADPQDPRFLLMGYGAWLLYSADQGQSWNEAGKLDGTPSLVLFVPPQGALIMTAQSLYAFSRETKTLQAKPLTAAVANYISASAGLNRETKNPEIYILTTEKGKAEDKGNLPANYFATGKASARADLYVSANQGETWEKIAYKMPLELEKENRIFSQLKCAEQDPQTVYMVCRPKFTGYGEENDGYWHGIIKTTDAGKTWNWAYRARGGKWKYQDSVHNYAAEPGFEDPKLRDGWVGEGFNRYGIGVCFTYNNLFDLGVCAAKPDFVIFTDFWRTAASGDGGKTWEETYSERQADGSWRSRGIDNSCSFNVYFDPFDSNHILVSWTDIGLQSSYNRGQSWFRSVKGIPPMWDNTCYGLAFDPAIKGKVWSVWTNHHDLPRFRMTRDEKWQEHIAGGGVCVSTDGAQSWRVTNGGLDTKIAPTWIILDPQSPVNQRTLYITIFGRGVYKSTDDGKTWVEKNNGVGKNRNAFGIYRQPDGRLLLVITPAKAWENGKPLLDFTPGEVYSSTDGAETWNRVVLPNDVKYPTSITWDPANPKHLYVTAWGALERGDWMGGTWIRESKLHNDTIQCHGGVLSSVDDGKTWTNLYNPKVHCYSLTIDPREPERMFLSTFWNAVMLSEDAGKSWQQLPGYSFSCTRWVAVDPYNPDGFYVATFGASLWYGVLGK